METSKVRRPRASRLQFSLRLLLIALTAFSIGFPIWYRWPYQYTVVDRNPATGKVRAMRTVTVQRQWGGGSLVHGPVQRIIGDTKSTEIYVRGKRQGPYTLHDPKQQTSESGQYDDLKEGRWIRKGGSMRTTTTWRRGMLDGEAVLSDHKGKQIVATFDAGRLVNYNGKRVDDRTFDAIRKQLIDDKTAAALQQGTNIDFVGMPLKDVIRYIEEVHGIPIVLDSRANFPLDVPVTATLSGLDLKSALAVITAPHDLACDYRYGLIWITKAEDVKNWRDPTGVADISPPNGSSLSRAWNEPIVIDSVQLPLADVMTFLATKAAISIDLNRVDKTAEGKPIMVTATIRSQPLKHALGHLLYNSGCCCELDGETLVIRPLERQ